jgi:hypothetical protein
MQAGGHAGGDGVEAVQAGDFLDEVDLADEIVPEGRRLPARFAVGVRRELIAAKDAKLGFYNVKGNVNSQQTFNFART